MAKSTRNIKTVEKIDFQKDRVFITMHQTENRNVVKYFNGGDDAEADAKAHASKRAAQSKCFVAVFGPQIALIAPPAAPTVTEVQLDWTGPDEQEQDTATPTPE